MARLGLKKQDFIFVLFCLRTWFVNKCYSVIISLVYFICFLSNNCMIFMKSQLLRLFLKGFKHLKMLHSNFVKMTVSFSDLIMILVVVFEFSKWMH